LNGVFLKRQKEKGRLPSLIVIGTASRGERHRLIDEARDFSDRPNRTNAPELHGRARDDAMLIFVMPRARKFKLLCSVLEVLALAGLVGYLARRRKNRKSPLVLAQAAHDRWLAHPDDAGASRNCYSCVARLVGWFDNLPLTRRIEACREEGLAVEMDPLEENGPAPLLRRGQGARASIQALPYPCRHRRARHRMAAKRWFRQWDALRPPEGIAVPATAILDCGSKGQWTLRFLSPYRCEPSR
jgi:hypothetical protein